MAIHSVEIALQAIRSDGRSIPAADFAEPLQARADELDRVVLDQGPDSAALIVFPITRLQDCRNEAEPHEAFERRLTENLLFIAGWLERRPLGIFDDLRSRGLEIRLFADVWMDQDQMEISLPPSLLAACGNRGLSVFLMTNDIRASQWIERGAI